MKFEFIDLGLRDYQEVLEIQYDYLNKRKNHLCPDTVLFTEHLPVITIGRSGSYTDITADEETLSRNGIKIVEVNRGGGVALHLPGQWLIYPIIDLNLFGKDIPLYLKMLEDWIIEFLALYRIKASHKGTLAGVWVGEHKICFIGIGLSRWVSFHGVSLNISVDLESFRYIRPCGIKNLKVTSLEKELQRLPPKEELKANLIQTFSSTFISHLIPKDVS